VEEVAFHGTAWSGQE